MNKEVNEEVNSKIELLKDLLLSATEEIIKISKEIVLLKKHIETNRINMVNNSKKIGNKLDKPTTKKEKDEFIKSFYKR